MKAFVPFLLSLCLAPAMAQEIQPIGPGATPTSPTTSIEIQPVSPVQPTGPQPTNAPPTTPQPARPAPATPAPPVGLPGVTATLSSPLVLKGKATLVLQLKSSLSRTVNLSAPRDNRQDCVFAPLVRVLRVGTREVVYPNGSGNVKLCAQDMGGAVLRAGGTAHFTRTLELPAGEYMVEGWFMGLADGTRVKLDAKPLRVTVK